MHKFFESVVPVSKSILLALRFLRVVTMHKLCNSTLIRLQQVFGKMPGRAGIRTMPESLSVEPASICNLCCPECTLGGGRLTRNSQLMSLDTFCNAFLPIAKWLVNCQFYWQGEPTLNPDLCQMISIAHSHNVFTNLSTNGQTLTPELCRNLVSSGLDQITVSVDGTTQDVYAKYRIGGSLQATIDGIGNLSEARRQHKNGNPLIEVQFIVFAHNEHQISDIKRIARQWGADRVVLKTAQVENLDNANQILPRNPKHSRYRQGSDGKYYISKKYPVKCFRVRSTMVVSANGEVAVCCYDKNCHYTFGNVNTENAVNIWKGQKSDSVRRQVLVGGSLTDICRNCGE